MTRIIILSLICCMLFTSCKKEAGEGGTSSIRGKIIVQDYNATFTVLNAEYDGADRTVYIIYGDNVSHNDRTRTSYDGVFEFSNLRRGNYEVYTYSEDSTLQSSSGEVVVKEEVEITEKKQIVSVPDMIVFE
ncbi:hypothetical protein JYT51_01500 [Candidatus Amoebophilus asiaticus]|nr:hypothetical protein [Candidatus Amoebophilus asiaticus]